MIVSGPPEIDSMGIRDLIRSQDFVIVVILRYDNNLLTC